MISRIITAYPKLNTFILIYNSSYLFMTFNPTKLSAIFRFFF